MGKQHLMGYDPVAQEFKWSTYYAGPGDALGDSALFAVTAFAAVAGNAQGMAAPSYSSSQYSDAVKNTHGALDRYHAAAGKRRSATELVTEHAFVLTQVEDGRKKGVGLMGISLETGEGEKQILLNDKQPEYSVDEPMNRLFHIKGGKQITAYSL
jgi:hypothetical protein